MNLTDEPKPDVVDYVTGEDFTDKLNIIGERFITLRE